MKFLSAEVNIMLQVIERSSAYFIRDYHEIELLQNSKKGSEEFAQRAYTKLMTNLEENSLIVGQFRRIYNLERTLLNEITHNSYAQAPELIIGIDGMTNYKHAIPYFAIVMAIVEPDSLRAGIIYCPILGEYFFAERGKGGWKTSIGQIHNIRMRVSGREQKHEILCSTYDEVRPQFPHVVNIGCEAIAIAYTAAGRFDLHYLSSRDVFQKLARLFCQESGGKLYNEDRIFSNGVLKSF